MQLFLNNQWSELAKDTDLDLLVFHPTPALLSKDGVYCGVVLAPEGSYAVTPPMRDSAWAWKMAMLKSPKK
ncbi:MAG: hypothetical protein AAFY26_25920 [Cyanobacteria bacterium J06638_22]